MFRKQLPTSYSAYRIEIIRINKTKNWVSNEGEIMIITITYTQIYMFVFTEIISDISRFVYIFSRSTLFIQISFLNIYSKSHISYMLIHKVINKYFFFISSLFYLIPLRFAHEIPIHTKVNTIYVVADG